jgi:hypothetical protein
MRRILVLLTVAAMMALGVAGQAWADAQPNAHNCAGVFSSDFSPQGTSNGQWGTYMQPLAHSQQADEEAQKAPANCS